MQNEVTLTPVTVIYAVLSCVVYLLIRVFFTHLCMISSPPAINCLFNSLVIQ